MRYFGVLSSVTLFFVLWILSAVFSMPFLYNAESLELNLAGLVIVCLSFYFLATPYYKTKPVLIRIIYLLVTIAILNFSLSFLTDLVRRTSKPPTLAKDDWSGLFIVPMILIVALIWGWVFDWRKNKIAKSHDADE